MDWGTPFKSAWDSASQAARSKAQTLINSAAGAWNYVQNKVNEVAGGVSNAFDIARSSGPSVFSTYDKASPSAAPYTTISKNNAKLAYKKAECASDEKVSDSTVKKCIYSSPSQKPLQPARISTKSPSLQDIQKVVLDARNNIEQQKTKKFYCLAAVFGAIGTNTPNGLPVSVGNLEYHGTPSDWLGHWAEDAGPELERVGYTKLSYKEYRDLVKSNSNKDIEGTVAVTPGTTNVPPGHISISDGNGIWLDYDRHLTPNAINGTKSSDSTFYVPITLNK